MVNIDLYYKTKTQEYKTEKFIEFVETNNNLLIRYQ